MFVVKIYQNLSLSLTEYFFIKLFKGYRVLLNSYL